MATQLDEVDSTLTTDNQNDDLKEQKTKFESKELLSDEQILKLGIAKDDINLYRMTIFKNAFTLDKWINIPQLKQFTFDSIIINISTQQVKSFLIYCRYIQSKSVNAVQQDIQQYRLNKTQVDADLNDLKNTIDSKIKSLQWEIGFFAKFNCRSPKDAFAYDGKENKVSTAFHHELDAIKQRKNITNIDDFTANDALTAHYISQSKLLKMNSGQDVIDTFARSFRSLTDLYAALRFTEQQYIDISIALRKWNDKVPINPHGEFRCFVHNKQLNAITQYVDNVYFDILVDKKEIIKNRILNFYENNIKAYIPMDSFVIDFLVMDIETMNENDDEKTMDEIFIIELNPFYKSAGAGLFSWKENRELFLNGPCEIRIRNDVDPLEWKSLHISFRKSFEKYKEMNKNSGNNRRRNCVVL